ncbi:MAG: response regulator [Myxococcota bacterium]
MNGEAVGSVDPGPGLAARRVLVVEDNVDAAEALQMLLEFAGHEVRIAFDARRGIDLAKSWRPHVILSDLGLPGGMDGYDLARALGTELERPWTLVALSGYGRAEDKARAREAGFDAHLTKPVEIEALERLLGQ